MPGVVTLRVAFREYWKPVHGICCAGSAVGSTRTAQCRLLFANKCQLNDMRTKIEKQEYGFGNVL